MNTLKVRILIFCWSLQFYFKKHYLLGGTLITAFVMGMYYRIIDGTWEMLMCGVIVVLVSNTLYHLARFAIAVLDDGLDRTIKYRLDYYSYRLKELDKYLQAKQVNK